MPGVSRAGPNSTTPVLRGANSDDSQVFLEGSPVPILYHLGGLTSFVHARLLEAVDLYPSNFSVRYGRKAGGVVDVRLRDPRTDGLHGVADVSLIDSSLLVETPITDQVAVLAAARRSNIDAVLGSALSSDTTSVIAAPVYWDYQAEAAYKPTDRDRLRLIAYGSSDRFGLAMNRPADVDPAVRGAFDVSEVFHAVQLGYRHRWAEGSEQNTEVTYGRQFSHQAFGTLGLLSFDIDNLQGRSEWTGVASPAFRVTAGVDVLAQHFSGSYSGIPPTTGENDPNVALSSIQHVAVAARVWRMQPGAYLDFGLRPIPQILIVPGIRADYDDLVHRGAIDPRASMRAELGPHTAFKSGFGRYSQSPEPPEAVNPIGNPALGYAHALHGTLGLEQELGESIRGSVEGFAKRLDGMVAGTPGGAPPFFENSQKGRIFGGELLLQVKGDPRVAPFFGFLSYTLMRSERRDAGQGWRLFDRDQTHVLATTWTYRLGRGWEVGATFRYTTGTPYTPVVSSTYDAGADVYLPRSGAPESRRNPAFTRLDARVEKKWTFTRWSIAAYLDVQNVFNAENAEGFSYSYDYSRRQAERGLPIFPNLGVRGEL
jgi:hypothetical protein